MHLSIILDPRADVLHAENAAEMAALYHRLLTDAARAGERELKLSAAAADGIPPAQAAHTPFGFGRNFAGFEKRLCAYSKKSLWCGRSSGRVVPPLAAGRSPTDDFLSS